MGNPIAVTGRISCEAAEMRIDLMVNPYPRLLSLLAQGNKKGLEAGGDERELRYVRDKAARETRKTGQGLDYLQLNSCLRVSLKGSNLCFHNS